MTSAKGAGKSPEQGGRPKVAVIGAGLAGLTVALELTKRQFAVTLLERREQVGGNLSSKQFVARDRDTLRHQLLSEVGGLESEPDLVSNLFALAGRAAALNANSGRLTKAEQVSSAAYEPDKAPGPKEPFWYDIYPHMFLPWYHNFWRIVRDDLGIDRATQFEAHETATFLSASKDGEFSQSQVKQFTNASDIGKALFNLADGPVPPADTIIWTYATLDLMCATGPRSFNSVSGYLSGQPYMSERVAGVVNELVTTIWAIDGWDMSAQSYRNLLLRNTSFLKGEPFCYVLKESLQTGLMAVWENKLRELGCVVRTEEQVFGFKEESEGFRILTNEAATNNSKALEGFDKVVFATSPWELWPLLEVGADSPASSSFALAGQLESKPIPVLNLVFKHKLPDMPDSFVGLESVPGSLAFLDISKAWSKVPDMGERTVLAFACSAPMELIPQWRANPTPLDHFPALISLVQEMVVQLKSCLPQVDAPYFDDWGWMEGVKDGLSELMLAALQFLSDQTNSSQPNSGWSASGNARNAAPAVNVGGHSAPLEALLTERSEAFAKNFADAWLEHRKLTVAGVVEASVRWTLNTGTESTKSGTQTDESASQANIDDAELHRFTQQLIDALNRLLTRIWGSGNEMLPDDRQNDLKQRLNTDFLSFVMGSIAKDSGNIDWDMTRLISNVENPLFINKVGNDYEAARPQVSYPELPNRYFAGQYTKNGVGASTIEGAVTSGLLAAQAIVDDTLSENNNFSEWDADQCESVDIVPDVPGYEVLTAHYYKLGMCAPAYWARWWSEMETLSGVAQSELKSPEAIASAQQVTSERIADLWMLPSYATVDWCNTATRLASAWWQFAADSTNKP